MIPENDFNDENGPIGEGASNDGIVNDMNYENGPTGVDAQTDERNCKNLSIIIISDSESENDVAFHPIARSSAQDLHADEIH
jgi:hypothetical protein